MKLALVQTDVPCAEGRVELALFLRDNHIRPEQVQDFYPTPGTISTCMFYTELDPYTMEKVYVPKTPKEKAMQRALLQYFRPQNREIVLEALKAAGRRDLIGTSPKCLVADIERGRKTASAKDGERTWQKSRAGSKQQKSGSKQSSQNSRKSSSKNLQSNTKNRAGRKKKNSGKY